MSTVRDVVTLALRQARVLGIGREARASEAAAGLQAYQAMLDAWVANGMFGQLVDTYETENCTAEEGQRIIAPTSITVTIPTTFDDCENGGTRAPRDLALVETVLNGTRAVKLYDRTGWVDLLGLTLNTDPAPLSGRGVSGLAACVAQTYAEMFGASLMPNTAMLAREFKGMIARKFGTERPKEAATYY
jgi:hypothetical protein